MNVPFLTSILAAMNLQLFPMNKRKRLSPDKFI